MEWVYGNDKKRHATRSEIVIGGTIVTGLCSAVITVVPAANAGNYEKCEYCSVIVNANRRMDSFHAVQR